MSVINKMLQDLDKRNGRPGGEAVPGDAIRSTKPSSAWSGRQSVLVVLVGLVAVSAAGAWWTHHHASAATSTVVVPVPPVVVAAGNATPTAAPVASPAAVMAAPATQAMVSAHPTASMPTGKPSPTLGRAGAVAASNSPKVLTVAASPEEPKPLEVAASRGLPKTPSLSAPAAPSAPAMARDSAEKIETAARPTSAAPPAKSASAKTYSPTQMSASLVAEAVRLDQQGHLEEAKASLRRALATNPLDVQARQLLVRLEIDSGRVDEAASLLVEGRQLHPEQPDFTLTLARLKADAGDGASAIQILEAGAAAARDDPQYHALLAALLVRTKRYEEAAQHYLVALRSDPANARWLVGVGVALEGMGNPRNAIEAYRRAEGTSKLSPEMAAFVSERLAGLSALERGPAPEVLSSARAPGL